MLETIQSGALPARVREFYVFGSYARGANEPGDLDVIVVHDQPSEANEAAAQRNFERKGFSVIEKICKASAKFHADMRRPLRKPGEKIDILLAGKVDEVLGPSSKVNREDLVLLWSEANPDYRVKLEALGPNPTACRAPRDHIISLKRLHDSFATMECTVELVRNKNLLLTRLAIEDIDCNLNSYHSHWLACWSQCKVMGKESMKLLPDTS
jgi:hypothetical protein